MKYLKFGARKLQVFLVKQTLCRCLICLNKIMSVSGLSKLRRTSLCTMACSEVPALLLLPVPEVAAD